MYTLKLLLQDFIDDLQITQEELIATDHFLFKNTVLPPFFMNEELFDTVLYLKDLMEENSISDLNGVVRYFNNKKKEAEYAINAIIEGDEREQVKEFLFDFYEAPFNFNHDIEISISDYIARLYNTDINLQKGKYDNFFKQVREQMCHYLSDNIMNFTENHLWMTGEMREETKTYLHLFANRQNGEKIYYTHSIGSKTAIEFKDTADLFSELNHAYIKQIKVFSTSKMQEQPEVSYLDIIELLDKNRPVKSHRIKKRLTEWLVYSKISNPAYTSALIGCKSHLNLELKKTEDEICYLDRNYLNTKIKCLYEGSLSDKKWVVLKSPPGLSWLTSDNPGFTINYEELSNRKDPLPDPFLGNMNDESVVLYYPLSKEYCLRVQPYGKTIDSGVEKEYSPIEIEQSSEKELMVVNGFTYSTHLGHVFSSDRKALEQFEPTV